VSIVLKVTLAFDSNLAFGEVVPIPTLPPLAINILPSAAPSSPKFNPVVLAAQYQLLPPPLFANLICPPSVPLFTEYILPTTCSF